MVTLIFVLIMAVSVLILGLLSLRQKSGDMSGIFFSILAFFVIFWLINNQLGINTIVNLNSRKVFTYLDFASGILLTYSFLLSTISFHPAFKTIIKKWWLWALGAVTLLNVVFINKVVTVDVYDNSLEVSYGLLYPLFVATLIINLVIGISELIKSRQVSVGFRKSQINAILYGLFFAAFMVLTANTLLTAVLKTDNSTTVSSNLSYVGVFVFVVTVSRAIISHGLFELKLAAARATAYILSLSVLVLVYVVITFGLLGSVLSLGSTQFQQRLIFILMLIVTAVFFQKIKNFFDKITNRIFYKDSYDPQEFLDQLNSSIVSNIEIGILLRHTTQIIEENIKCGFCQIIIPNEQNSHVKVTGTKDIKYSDQEIGALESYFTQSNKKTTKIEDIDSNDLAKILNKKDIAVVSHLTTSSYGSQQTIAYFIFGQKKSDNVYSKQDLRIIDIISDELVIAIQNALRFEEIQEFNVTLQKKVNDATGKLKRTNEKLKALDETKDEFISMASHQLRTPLTSVKGYLSMVLEGDAGEINDNQRKLLDQAFVSSQRMVYLISDLLNVSRLRTGKFIIDAHPCNLADVVESEIAQLKEQAKGKNQILEFDKPADFPELMLDETKIRQVIMNFSDNALFYTPSGGSIKIQLREDGSHIYFMVKDNGIGVPKEEQKHMFTKFYRAKNARTARPDGTGLGLFMAKKVITAQGGNVLFESAEGKGSTFGFSFNKKHLANVSAGLDDTSQSS